MMNHTHIAKALNTRLTDNTIYTEHRQIVGTLLCMSAEQAELSGLDIDTRSDITPWAVGAEPCFVSFPLR